MKNLIFITLLTLTLGSCSSNVDLAIDNPSSEAIIVKIDTLLVEVPAKEVVWVEMGKGEHQVTLENDSIVKFDFQQEAYMLNPTLSEYIMMEEYYGSPAFQNSAVSTIPNKKITFLGIELEGNYEVVKNLITPVKWEYGPREVLPEMIEIEEGDNYTLLTKLYDTLEILNMMGQDTSSSDEVTEPLTE
ncbi:hypothetical protein [Flavobacterium sp. HNIBRBA15423]|uniref:hypothetical protein n=1 Tax=Flavobacterium sp. HNIBRBA15423 TaxID=3458683 RepID=UPI004044C340